MAEHCDSQRGCALGNAWWLPGEGQTLADIMFVGEAPREGESRGEGVFVTRLRELLHRLNVSRYFVTDAVKCPAPELAYRSRREPTVQQRVTCQMWLAQEIANVSPKMIVPLGATAAWAVVRALGGPQKEARTLAGFERQFGPQAVLKGIYVCPLTHPSRIEVNRLESWLADGVKRLRTPVAGLCFRPSSGGNPPAGTPSD